MKDKKYILASASPRRKELMEGLDLDFTIEIYECDESYAPSTPILEIPEYLSKIKSLAFKRDLEESEVLITADTMVLCDGLIMGKPIDRDDAIKMLRLLSGKKHQVLTGVTIRSNTKKVSFTAITEVSFKKLKDEEIIYFIDKYKPFDKAGSYAVQEWIGYIGICSINGSFYNVMGLPVQMLYEELGKF